MRFGKLDLILVCILAVMPFGAMALDVEPAILVDIRASGSVQVIDGLPVLPSVYFELPVSPSVSALVWFCPFGETVVWAFDSLNGSSPDSWLGPVYESVEADALHSHRFAPAATSLVDIRLRYAIPYRSVEVFADAGASLAVLASSIRAFSGYNDLVLSSAEFDELMQSFADFRYGAGYLPGTIRPGFNAGLGLKIPLGPVFMFADARYRWTGLATSLADVGNVSVSIGLGLD